MSLLLAWIVLTLQPAASGEVAFDEIFTGRTLRLEMVHSGCAAEEHLARRRVRLEGPWPGSHTQLVDTTNLGKYLFEVVDLATNRVVYSRGFCTVYGEWETTGEALRGDWRAFDEIVRFPEPRHEVQVVFKKRAADGTFREMHSLRIDPADRSVDRSPIPPQGAVWTLFESAPASRAVDLLVLGDGYTAAENEGFREDVQRLVGILFATEPFAGRKSDFNVRALLVPAPGSGISNPRAGIWHAAPLGCRFNSFDSDRYVLTFEERRLREIAAQVPYDALLIVCNARKYGGGGIFNLWATCAADSSAAGYVFVHEFGHSFAGLGDEYYTSQVAYEQFNAPGAEPWEPNITALLDPARLKWRDLVAEGTPLPTPWDQSAYDRLAAGYQSERATLRQSGADEAAVEDLFARHKAASSKLLSAEPYAGEVGAFEGASYQARGLYRPCADCIMFTRNPDHFCPVCRRAIERVIDLYAR